VQSFVMLEVAVHAVTTGLYRVKGLGLLLLQAVGVSSGSY